MCERLGAKWRWTRVNKGSEWKVVTAIVARGPGLLGPQELQEQCGDDPELAKMLMEAMDSDNDGQISFEDFRSSMLKVQTQLLSAPASQSTPDTAMSTPGNLTTILPCFLLA